MNPVSWAWDHGLLPALTWLVGGLDRVFDKPVLNRIGAFGLAVIAATVAIRLALLPIAVLSARRAQRIAASRRVYDAARSSLSPRLYGSPGRLRAELNALRRAASVPVWLRLLGLVPLVVQYALVVALYYAIADIGRSLPGANLGFAGIGNLTQSPADVCCTTAPGQHGNYVALMHAHPGALVLPLIAAVLTYVQYWLGTRRPGVDLSREERHARRAQRQTALVYPVLVFITGIAVPQAVALVWITQMLVIAAQKPLVARLARWHRGRREPLDLRRPAPEPAVAT
ncbi:MAG TPA: YidC/Oxa1 family membrane protein insertase [Candidatus Dormibacteraeota bacterium]|nr:YidC/Oxa1 family membrane protein insertase [Candidatus Dormibacteraeota bacterium]